MWHRKGKVTIDIRVPTITTCDNVLRIIDDVITRVSAERGIKATYRIEDHTEPFEADHTSPLVRASACRPRCAKQTTFAFAQDRHWWYERLDTAKIPVITYGPGDAHASHTADERVNIEEYVASIEVYKSIFSPFTSTSSQE